MTSIDLFNKFPWRFHSFFKFLGNIILYSKKYDIVDSFCSTFIDRTEYFLCHLWNSGSEQRQNINFD